MRECLVILHSIPSAREDGLGRQTNLAPGTLCSWGFPLNEASLPLSFLTYKTGTIRMPGKVWFL